MGTAEKTDNFITISASKWAQVGLPDRLYYLESCRNNLRRVASFWVEEEATLRGHTPNSTAGAESWLLGPVPVARTLRYLINGVRSGGRPNIPSKRLRIDGRSVSRVFPSGFSEGLLFWDIEAHVWSIGSELQGNKYRKARETSPGPALVLGASNVSSICATDMLSKLFCDNRPVVCKMPPRLQPLEPIFREIFHPLIRDGHLQILTGGREIGEKLLQEPIFDTVHLTGSVETYRHLLESNTFDGRTFTAELGCVTPALVVPGPWSQEELAYQARHLASLLTLNGGFNCVTPQVLVLSKNWSHKTAFLKALRTELDKFKNRDDTFPGAPERRQSFRDDYPEAEIYGPRTLVELDPSAETRLFREEGFCGVVGWVELESRHLEDYLQQAVQFCKHKLWGDLSCLVLVDTLTRRLHERAIAQTLTALEYGTVGLNVFAGLGFACSVTPWGSYLDGKADTGNGWVHNLYFFDRPEKTVFEGPFVPVLPQPWVKPFPNLFQVGEALFKLELEPSTTPLLGFFKSFGGSLLKRRGGKRA